MIITRRTISVVEARSSAPSIWQLKSLARLWDPEAMRSRCSRARYGESLALIKHYDYSCYDPVNRGCDIWVMKQYGVVDSWTYMFNIHVVQASIYGFKRCGEVVLSENDNHGKSRMVSYDPKTNQFKVFGRSTEDYIYDTMETFVESLVLLDHANAISDQVACTKKVGRRP